MSSPHGETPFARALFAGAVAGTCVDLSLYPIDTLKTRLQASQGFQAAGGFRGIYAGIGSAALGAAPGAALFFATYERTKALLARRGAPWPEPLVHVAAASAGEVAACAVRVPTEVVKQRAQAAQHPSSAAALRAILALRRGPGGAAAVWAELYRGGAATVLRELPFTALQFPLWEALKAWRAADTGRRVSAWESGAFGSLAGGVAAAATTPLDVLKTRLMLAPERHSVAAMLARILRESGPRALFAGMAPRVAWISFGGFVFLGSYDFALGLMQA